MARERIEQTAQAALIEAVDQYFPKGDKRRGDVLVVGAIAMRWVRESVKAFGGCEKCYGKGYGTQTLNATQHADFDSDEERVHKLPTVVFCDCARGKQLRELMREKV